MDALRHPEGSASLQTTSALATWKPHKAPLEESRFRKGSQQSKRTSADLHL